LSIFVINNIMIGIYKITSPSGKIYIGQSINIEKRFKDYQYINSIKNQVKLYNSFKKYEIKNHKFEIVEECSIEQLNEREIYWGLYFNSIAEGLNHKLGNQNSIISEETKLKMSKKIYQYDLEGNFIREWNSISEPSLALKINKGWLSYIIDHPTYTSKGYRFTSGKENKLPPITKNYNLKKPILQFDKNNNFIREWSSAKEAAIQLGIFIQGITASARNETKTAGGYIWRYL